MLTRLRIQHFAIIESFDVTFLPGFTVLTGETGAGKSIIVDAISLVMGAAATEDMIQSSADQAVVEATFQVDPSVLPDFARDFLDGETLLTVQRKITRGKPSEARVNMSPITLKKLKSLMVNVISISGQNEHLQLFDRGYQQYLLDQFAGDAVRALLAGYQSDYRRYCQLQSDYEAFEQNQVEYQRKMEFLAFQIQDIGQHQFFAPEEDELKAKQQQLKHLGLVEATVSGAIDAVEVVIDRLTYSGQLFDKVSHLASPIYPQLSGQIQDQLVQVEEIRRALVSEKAANDAFDVSDLTAIEDRLDLIFRFKHKYHCQNLADLIAVLDGFQQEYDRMQLLVSDSTAMARQLTAMHDTLQGQYVQLFEARKTFAAQLSDLMNQQLADLHFLYCSFQIDVRLDEGSLSEYGANTVEFMISANQGEPHLPIAAAASGGELSRILLAIKTIFNQIYDVDTVIFDEIDTGIGGITATKIGEKIKLIAAHCQVLCVTHLAQIAKFADHHLVISKGVEDQKTVTYFQMLAPGAKAGEIKRMIGGEAVLEMLSL